MMRLAIVATPAALPDLRPAPGSLDGDVIRSRLTLGDTAFQVVDLDPAIDLAEQLELLFERTPTDAGACIVFYASSPVMMSAEGELFLCLDPQSPDTGDSVADIAQVFCERAAGSVAFVMECRHAPDPDDPFRSASVAAAAKDAVRSAKRGRSGPIELLVAARPSAPAGEERPSPMTRALIEALDDASGSRGLTLGGFYTEVHESDRLLGVVPSFTHVDGSADLVLVQPSGVPSTPPPALAEPTPAPPYVESSPAPPYVESSPSPPYVESSPLPQVVSAPVIAEPIAAAPMIVEPVGVALHAPSSPIVEDAPVAAAPAAPPAMRARVPSLSEIDAESLDEEVLEEVEESVDRRPPAVAKAPPPPPRAAPRGEPGPARVVISEPARPAPAPVIEAPPAPEPSPPPPVIEAAPPPTPAPPTATEHVAAGDALMASGDGEGALAAYRRALGMLGPSAVADRADIFVRIAQVKRAQDKRKEAIASYEKALGLVPEHRSALLALVELNVLEKDWRAVLGAEERLLSMVESPGERFTWLVEFGERWRGVPSDTTGRARASFERARELRPEDLFVLGKLRRIYEADGAIPEMIATRRRMAELTTDLRSRAEQYFELAQQCLHQLHREELGIELLELALESDPTMLEPLTVVARFFADRQEWSELERAYRTMLGRAHRIPNAEVRSEVTWELCRRLGLLFRDHLEDPALALDAFEDAVAEKPNDLQSRLTAADVAKTLGRLDRAALHLQAAASIDASQAATFHELFEVFQRLRRPDQAFAASQVTMFAGIAESRERFIFEEHRSEGVPKFARAMRSEGWDLLRTHDRDQNLEAVFAAVTPAVISARLGQLSLEGRLPSLDPAARQDPQKSTLSIVRSFTWASHFLGVPPPAIYLHDDATVGLASIIAEEPTALAGGRVLRGRTLSQLAFLVGRHLGYHAGCHRILLYYPSIEELSVCFLAAVKLVIPELPVPQPSRAAVKELSSQITARLDDAERGELNRAVSAFEKAGRRANIAAWVGAVERCSARAGLLLCGDLEVASGALQSEPLGLVGPEAKLADLMSFTVSDEHHHLREELGVAIQP